MIIGSFGASAVLIYGAIRRPLSQARNLIEGHVLSAVVGVTAFKLLPGHLWLAPHRLQQPENSHSWRLVYAYPREDRTRHPFCSGTVNH
jgi:hypothetical protein